MQKLLQESKNVEYESEENEGTPVRVNDIPQPHPTNHSDKLSTRRSGIHFTCEEDKYLRLAIEKFGLRWTKILRNSDFHFNECRLAKILRKRAEALKLVKYKLKCKTVLLFDIRDYFQSGCFCHVFFLGCLPLQLISTRAYLACNRSPK